MSMGSDIQTAYANGNEPLSASEAARVVWHERKLVAITTILFIFGAALIAYLAEPMYRATAIVSQVGDAPQSQLASLVGRLGGFGITDSFSIGAPISPAEAIATLQSEQFLSSFIKDNELLPLLFWKKWDPVSKAWLVDADEEPPSLQDGYTYFLKEVLSVKQDRDTSLVTITVDWRDPKLAATWANALVSNLNAVARRRAIDETQKSLAFLEHELERTSTLELRQSIYRVIETQLNSAMLANVREDFAFRVVSPALPPEMDRYVSPRRLLMLALGSLCGFMVGAALALFRSAVKRNVVSKTTERHAEVTP